MLDTEFPRHTHPHSNEREMLFMDGEAFRPGSDEYMKVLAHELQHAIHWAHDQGEDSWVNEGLSEVATELVGYSPTFIDAFSEQSVDSTHLLGGVGRQYSPLWRRDALHALPARTVWRVRQPP